MSLRSRLILSLSALAAVGLLVLGAVTYGSLRSFEVNRVDDQASAAVDSAVRELVRDNVLEGAAADPDGDGRGLTAGTPEPPGVASRDSGGPARPRGARRRRPPDLPPAGTYAQQRDSTGKVAGGAFLGVPAGETQRTAPTLPADLTRGEHSTISSGDSRYRVLAVATPSLPSQTTVIAVPFTEVDATLDRLLLIEGIVIAAVLALLALASAWIVRLGLRPLDRIGATAGAIVAGDLSRRVEPAESRTEVGRLGLALNAMLGRLETAFAERRASEERLRRFLADASHELRTPLASIRGYAELFRIGAAREGPEMEKAMSRIEDESARMGVLVEDLLALARLDEVRNAHREPVDMAALAADAVDDARAVAPDRTISLAGAQPAVVDGDPGQLRQVLANLMRNALVHTPGGSSIEVTVERDDGWVRLSVRDHGPGLPPGDAAELFERFWRADPGRERGRAGAGLGLSIVAAVVGAHDGRAMASDADGGGACFVVTLPLAVSAGVEGS